MERIIWAGDTSREEAPGLKGYWRKTELSLVGLSGASLKRRWTQFGSARRVEFLFYHEVGTEVGDSGCGISGYTVTLYSVSCG